MPARSKAIAISQPVYLPWLGYFEQIAYADHFVFYDDVQYTKQDWRNRNRILGPAGPVRLTVPVRKAPLGTPIREIEIDNTHYWVGKHLKSIQSSYRRAPAFDPCYEMLQRVLQRDWRFLADLDIALTRALCGMLGLAPAMSRSSEVPRDPEFAGQLDDRTADPALARRNLRLIEVCRHYGARHYYAGARARTYTDIGLFARFGIRVWFQAYVHPVYPQQFRSPQSHMSIIDLLMNVGAGARQVLLSSPPPGFAGQGRRQEQNA